jgi:putative DNA primase/helicase
MSISNNEGLHINTEVALEFLRAFRPGGPWVITAIIPDGETTTRTFNDERDLCRFITDYNERGENIYYSINPLKGAMAKKAAKADIASVEYIYVDADPNGNETPDQFKQRFLGALNGLRPTFVVDSGNGIQLLLLLESALELSDDAKERKKQITNIEARVKALLLKLGAPAGTQNIDRLFRVPGTINFPNAKKLRDGRTPRAARLIAFNDTVHALENFPPAQEQPRQEKPRSKKANGQLPSELRHMLYLTGDKPAGYPSRSELFWAFINRALKLGIDENVIISACLACHGYSIFEHVNANGGEDYIKRQILRAMNEIPSTGDKMIIRVNDTTEVLWRKTEQALKAKDLPIYRRGWHLYQPKWRIEEVNGRKILIAECVRFNPAQLSDMVAYHAAIFQSWDQRKQSWRKVDPPEKVIKALLEIGDADFPQVSGIITSPTMRPDGALLIEPGYDAVTQLWYKPAPDVELPVIPDQPTKEQAEAALGRLNELLDGFPFEDETPENKHSTSRSAVLAGMMTAVLRGAFEAAPIFVITAPEARTGKSYIVVLIAVLATGHRPVPIAGSDRREEMEKRIETTALKGRAIMHLNNLPNGMALESEALSQMSADGNVSIRTLGKHEEADCQCRGTTIFVNGNNIKVVADLVPKTALCCLDARMENPEGRAFTFDPVETVRRNRSTYLADVFTIARAFETAGCPKPDGIKTVTGYEDWSKRVQQPLTWLGEADPMGGVEKLRAMDPHREELRRLIDALKKSRTALGDSFTVSDCTKLTEQMTTNSFGRTVFDHPELRDLMTLRGKVNGRYFGHLLGRHVGRIIDGASLQLLSKDGRAGVYRLELLSEDKGRDV